MSSVFYGQNQRSAASTLLTAAPTAADDPNMPPGMKAALAAGPHSHKSILPVLAGGTGLGLFKKNASPLQDIAAALSLGRPVTAADWLKAGFGPGGISLDGKAPTILDPSVQAAAEEARKNAANAQGRLSTILTSGLGDPSQAATAKKTLLGA